MGVSVRPRKPRIASAQVLDADARKAPPGRCRDDPRLAEGQRLVEEDAIVRIAAARVGDEREIARRNRVPRGIEGRRLRAPREARVAEVRARARNEAIGTAVKRAI
jgi:hypothetical protein